MALHLTALGWSLRDQFLAKMQQLTQQRAVLLLPSGWLVQLVREQMPQLRTSVMTLDGFIEACGQGRSETILPRLAQEFLLRSLLDSEHFPYFSRIRDQQALPAQLAGVISALIRGNVGPEEFTQVVIALTEDGDSPKNREMALLYKTYMLTMEATQKVDVEMACYRLVAALQAGEADIPFEAVYAADFYAFSPLELALLREVDKRCELQVGMCYEKQRPRVFRASQKSVESLCGFLSVRTSEPPAAAFASTAGWRESWPELPAAASPAVVVVEAASVRQEIAYAAAEIKRLLTKGLAPNEMLISARDLTTYNGIKDQFAAAGIPVRLPVMATLLDDPLGRLIDALLRARATMQALDVADVLKSPVWGMAGETGELLERWLRETWPGRVAWNEAGEAACPEAGQACLAKIRAILDGLPLRGRPAEYFECLTGLLDLLAWPKVAAAWYQNGDGELAFVKRAALAEQAVRDYFDQLAEALRMAGEDETPIPVGRFYEWFHKRAKECAYRLLDEEPAGVWVIPAASLTGISKTVVFLLGVEDESFPKAAQENWLYSQQERQLLAELGVDLGGVGQALAEDYHFFASVLAVARQTLYLSFNRDGNKTPSRYLGVFLAEASTRRVVLPNTYPLQDPGQAASCRQLAAALAFAGQPFEALAAAGLLDGAAAAAFGSEAHRALPNSPYNGQLQLPAALALARQRADGVFSVTALEKYYACPFQYFVETMLKLSAWQDQDGEVRPEIVGTMYHQVLARYVAARQTGQAHRTAQRELMACFQAVEEEMRRQGCFKEAAWPFELLEMRKNLLAWLNYDEQVSQAAGAYQQHWLEWAFGQPADEASDPNSAARPFILPTPGGAVRLRGQVDRVDRVPNGLMVLDYKKGALPTAKQRTNGADLQLMVYLMAVEALLASQVGAPLLGGTYYSLERRTAASGLWIPEIKSQRTDFARRQLKAEEWEQFRETTQVLVGQAVEQIRQGQFAAAPLAACSSYCPAATFCRLPTQFEAEEDAGFGD